MSRDRRAHFSLGAGYAYGGFYPYGYGYGSVSGAYGAYGNTGNEEDDRSAVARSEDAHNDFDHTVEGYDSQASGSGDSPLGGDEGSY